MRRLEDLGPRQLTRRRGRALMTGGGVALGVAVLFAVLIATGGATRALDRSLAGQAGRADAVVSPSGSWDAALPLSTLDTVRDLEGVEDVAGSHTLRALLQMPGVVRDAGSRDGIIILVATDLAKIREIKEYSLVVGTDPAVGAPGITLSRRAADSIDAGIGDTLDITTTAGRRSVELTGIIDDAGAGLAYQGDVGYTSLPVGWALDARDESVNSIDVVLADGVDTDEWIRTVEPSLVGTDIVRAEDVASGFAELLGAITAGMTSLSAIAVFVGGFLVFLTFSLAVAERTRSFGTLRALGATPRQVRRVVIVEAVVLGAAATLVGLVLGYLLAVAAYGLIGNLLELSMPAIGLPVGPLLVSVVVGVGTSVLAAWLPGRRASAVEPVQAMRSGVQALEQRGRPAVRFGVLAVAIALRFAGLPSTMNNILVLVLLVAAVSCVPFALGPAAALTGRLTRRLGRGVGEIAVMHLVKERSRSAYTLALVMVVLAMLIAVQGTNASASQSVDDLLATQGQNIQVGAPSAFDPAVGQEIAQIPGVQAVAPLRFGRGSVLDGDRDVQVGVRVVEPDSYFEVASFDYDDGDDASARAALAGGGAALLPVPVADRIGAEVGDTFLVRTFESPSTPFRLAGTYDVIGGGLELVVGISDTAKFGDGRPNGFLVRPSEPGTDDRVAQTIVDAIGDRYAMVIDTPADTRAYARSQLNGFFGLAYTVLALAAVIGMLGLANTLAVSVIARTHEIGILRSTGTLRRQIRAMVLVEGLTLALVAFVLAVPLGALLNIGAITAGLGFVYPVRFLPPLLVLTVLVATIASAVPARAAGRLEPVAALRFD